MRLRDMIYDDPKLSHEGASLRFYDEQESPLWMTHISTARTAATPNSLPLAPCFPVRFSSSLFDFVLIRR